MIFVCNENDLFVLFYRNKTKNERLRTSAVHNGGKKIVRKNMSTVGMITVNFKEFKKCTADDVFKERTVR
jgi:hypothetical protein